MQRWIKQPNTNGAPLHNLEQFRKISPLHGQEPFQRGGAVLFVFGKNHLPHHSQAISFKEHMLTAAKTNAIGHKVFGRLRIARGVRIGSDPDIAQLIRPAQ